MKNIGFDINQLRAEFLTLYSRFQDSIFGTAAAYELYHGDPAATMYMNRLKALYEDDLPVRYRALDIISMMPYALIDSSSRQIVHNEFDLIKDRYVLPDALARISERYFGDRRLLTFDALTQKTT